MAATGAQATAPPQLAAAAADGHGAVLERLIRGTESSVIQAGRFFVSWSGVLVLAYQGFSPSLEALKDHISREAGSLPKENPGSKWPKTSLGCLREGVRLSPEQLKLLLRICGEESVALQQQQDAYDKSVKVDSLTVVTYECRCLERRLLSQRIPLLPDLNLAGPTPAEQQRVEAVMSEVDAPDYWYHASKDGSRENHYRGNALGVTLVHDLTCFDAAAGSGSANGHSQWGTALPGIVDAFRQRVEQELPGMYTWFADSSLHITIRALLG